MEDAAVSEDRILTIPNVLSVIRLLCVPVFLWLLFSADEPLAAAWLLAALGATDWVDGYIARHFNQVSNLGKILDPVADRILLLTAVVALMIDGAVPVGVAVLSLVREGLVTIAVLVLAALGAKRIDVTWYGKAGTFAVMFAFPLFLLGSVDDGPWSTFGQVAAWCCAIPGLILGYIALAAYVPLAIRALRDGRDGRRSATETLEALP